MPQPECRHCGAPVKAAKLAGSGKPVGLDNQPDVFRAGDKPDGYYRIVNGRQNPMIVEPKDDDVPGSFFREHECGRL